jgi:DNA modification methylase
LNDVVTLEDFAILRGEVRMAKANGSTNTARRALRGIPPLHGLSDLTADAKNANTGTPRGRKLLGQSLRQYGAGRSILTDRHGHVIAGNKTLEQATDLSLPIRVVDTDGSELVVVRRTDLDLAQDHRARELGLADNRIAELDLAWDPALLKQHLGEGVNLSAFWRPDELERLLGPTAQTGLTPDDAAITPRATTIRRGDAFRLGPHHLLCGDATAATDVARLLGSAAPGLMVTDPPYGVAYDPAWRQRRFPGQRTAVGPVAHDDRVDWREAFALFRGGAAYVWHAGLFAGDVAAALQASGFTLRSQIIWAKQHFALSRGDYHWQHEPCWYVVRRGGRSHWRGDRTQATVWSVANLNPMGGTRVGDNAVTGHSTQKPVALWERALLNHTDRGEAVYDPFVGSGTAVIAAEKTGRRAFVMDCDPVYVQATIDRWEAFAGATAQRLPERGR